MAYQTGATIEVPIYPLMQQGGTAGTVVPEMAGLISTEIAAHGASHVSVLGDSAGGNLALAAVEYMVANNETVPASMVLLSPWLDVRIPIRTSGSSTIPVPPAREWANSIGKIWAGDLPENNPLVSPLYGSLKGLPPTYVYSGSLDSVAPDALVLAARSRIPRSADQLRTGQRRNSRLGSAQSGRCPILAADRPGTRCLKTRCWKSAQRQKRAVTARQANAMSAGCGCQRITRVPRRSRIAGASRTRGHAQCRRCWSALPRRCDVSAASDDLQLPCQDA